MAKWMLIIKHDDDGPGRVVVEFFESYYEVNRYIDTLNKYFMDDVYGHIELYERVHSNIDGQMEYRKVNMDVTEVKMIRR